MAALLLAAGRSSRFGGNKLVAPLHGEPLIRHAARTLSALGFDHLVVVAGPDTPDLADLGFRAIRRPEENVALSTSLRVGVDTVAQAGATAVCIALADMPLVCRAHYAAMFDLFAGQRDPVGSLVNGRVQPPALFDETWFGRLRELAGDRGARELLANCPAVELTGAMAEDVDTSADLARLARK